MAQTTAHESARSEDHARAADRGELPRSVGWSLGSGTILQGLNSAMLAIALVPIAARFGDSAALPWVVSSLYLTAAVGAPTFGRLSDLFGARRVYLVGLIVILVASIAGPFVPSTGWLIADRALLGLGTSAQFPAAMAIIRQQASLRRRSAVGAIGVVAVCGQTSAAIGPTVGGLVVAALGWPSIFWVNLPMVANSAFWVIRTVPKDPARESRGWRRTLHDLDPLGMVLFVVAIVALMVGLLSLQDQPDWWAFAVSVPVLVLFVLWERRATEPFIDVRLMVSHRQLAFTCGRAILTFISFYCIFYGFPQWLEETRRLSPAVTGFMMFPVFGVGVVSTMVATRLGRQWNPRWLLLGGTSAMFVAGLALIFAGGENAAIWLLVLVAALMGVPNGFNNLGNQLLLHEAVPQQSAGSASGMYRTAQFVGAAISTVVVAHTIGASHVDGGIHLMGVCIASLGLVMIISNSIALIRRSDRATSAQGA